MPYCEFCGEEAGIMPFKCNYCGGNFCGKHRLPENHECKLDVEYLEKQVKKKQRIKEQYRIIKDIGVRGERSINGTLVLYTILVISSIIAYFYPSYMCINYFALVLYPYIQTYSFMWTLFTSIFVIYFSNPIELAYFIILLVCSYYYIRTIENKYGPKFLLFLFVSCSVLGGLFNLILSWIFLCYGFMTIYYFPIGLASGGLLGVNLFLLLDSSNKNWYFFKLKLKGKQIMWFLAISNVIVKVIQSILIYKELFFILVLFSIFWFTFDLFGLLGAVVFHDIYFKRRN